MFHSSAQGDGWAPTVLDDEEELNFLRETMGLFISNYELGCFIGGSSAIAYRDLGYDDYNTTDDAGNILSSESY